jgi:peptidoglycan/LPS O-acetylase OafA/YrhL
MSVVFFCVLLGVNSENTETYPKCSEDPSVFCLNSPKSVEVQIEKAQIDPIQSNEKILESSDSNVFSPSPEPSKNELTSDSSFYKTIAKLLLSFLVALAGITVISTFEDYYLADKFKAKPWHKYLNCFSLIRNTKLLVLKRSEEKFGKSDTFDIFNPVRFACLAWETVFHVFINSLDRYSISPLTLVDRFARVEYIIVYTSVYSVDIFFWISGFLMAYFFLVEVGKKEKYSVGDFLRFWLHRYLRLTPLFVFAVLLTMAVNGYVESCVEGCKITNNFSITHCKDYFYTILIYLKNEIPNFRGNWCLAPTWQLNVDMHLFLVFSTVLLVYMKISKLIGWVLVLGICGFSMVSSGMIADRYSLNPGQFLNNPAYDYFQIYYNKTYNRSPPYALGVAAGIFIYAIRNNTRTYDFPTKIADKSLKNKFIRIGIFLLGFLLIGLIIFAQYDAYSHPGQNNDFKYWTANSTILFFALERFGIGLGLTFIFVPLLLGHYQWIINILVWHPWNILARLTYFMFLHHYSIMFLIELKAKTDDEFVILNHFKDAATILFLSLMITVPVVVLIEFPILNLAKLIGSNHHGGSDGRSVRNERNSTKINRKKDN